MSRLAGAVGAVLVALLMVPMAGLVLSIRPTDVLAGLTHPDFPVALGLSIGTTAISMVGIGVLGTPLAWWLSRSSGRLRELVEVLVDLPVVIPPAVIGIGLLLVFGRQGLLGPTLASLGLSIPFTPIAVMLAQTVVAAPFYIKAAREAFDAVDPELVHVARTLGGSHAQVLWHIARPMALPGLITGAALAWARALGEFGATLLFAGNLPGRTQTLPLAIANALEQDIHLAVSFSVVLGAVGVVLLIALRALGHR